MQATSTEQKLIFSYLDLKGQDHVQVNCWNTFWLFYTVDWKITTRLIKEMPTFIIRNVFLEIDILKKLHQTLNRVNNKKERGD